MINSHQELAVAYYRLKRQHILDAACEVFSRKGYNRATVDEIIALADTGKGTVYNYFGNKEQLFYTLIQERSRPFEISLDQLIASEQPPLAKLKTMVTLYLKFYIENADLWRVLMHEIRGFSEGGKMETVEKYRSVYLQNTSHLEKLLQDGISQGALRQYDVKKASCALFSVILTMVYQNLIDSDVENTALGITDIFLNGMAENNL